MEKGWGRNHSVVNYVFTHEPELLVAYHFEVMDEMRKRGYNPDPIWYAASYRGSVLGNWPDWANIDKADHLRTYAAFSHTTIYPEHDETYLKECIANLEQKGIFVF